jgi:hypothetical protein
MDAQRIGSSGYLMMSFREIEYLMPLKESADKIRMFQTLLSLAIYWELSQEEIRGRRFKVL